MAMLTVSYDPDKDEVTKTLIFAGRQYIEIWEDNGCSCDHTIEYQLEQSGFDLPAELTEKVADCFASFGADQDIIMECLNALREYEKEFLLVAPI